MRGYPIMRRPRMEVVIVLIMLVTMVTHDNHTEAQVHHVTLMTWVYTCQYATYLIFRLQSIGSGLAYYEK